MKDKLIMSKKELNYKSILDQVLNKNINLKNASERLGISYRHTRRLFAKYKRFGDEGLVHKSRTKQSLRKTSRETIQKIIKLSQDKYKDFGPTLMAEKLEELGDIKINRETLRLILKANGIWGSKRTRKKHRTRRERKQKFGELLQLDGSIHNWLPDTDSKQCLMNLVDDATGKTLSFMDHGETTYAAFKLLRQWIEMHGVPTAIYVDLKSVYVSPKALQEDNDSPVESEWLTHFTKACKKLNIKVQKAYSPQAKGRVERNHAVYQDRFVKELKLQNITTIEEANQVLQNGFIDNLNNKFMIAPASEKDAHIELNCNQDLDNIFTWSYERTISNDMVIRPKF